VQNWLIHILFHLLCLAIARGLDSHLIVLLITYVVLIKRIRGEKRKKEENKRKHGVVHCLGKHTARVCKSNHVHLCRVLEGGIFV
jgi:hypothetical protein